VRRASGLEDAPLAAAAGATKTGVQLVVMQLEATGRAAFPPEPGCDVKSSVILLRTLASASAFAPSNVLGLAEHTTLAL